MQTTTNSPKGILRPWFQQSGFTRVRGVRHFWRHVEMTGDPTQCWPWTGGRSGSGYGMLRWPPRDGRMVYAHRLAFELSRGYAAPEDRVVRHLCGNPLCCRPSHLALGTRQQNMDDMVAQGRQRNRALTPEDVRAIREMGAQRARMVDICARFRVTQTTVWLILAGRTWRKLRIEN